MAYTGELLCCSSHSKVVLLMVEVQMLESLEGMTRPFPNPYIIFYPVLPRPGTTLPINKTIREIQGRSFSEYDAWRGNVVIAKFRGGGSDPFANLMDISMADFPILKNYLSTRGPMGQVCSVRSFHRNRSSDSQT